MADRGGAADACLAHWRSKRPCALAQGARRSRRAASACPPPSLAVADHGGAARALAGAGNERPEAAGAEALTAPGGGLALGGPAGPAEGPRGDGPPCRLGGARRLRLPVDGGRGGVHARTRPRGRCGAGMRRGEWHALARALPVGVPRPMARALPARRWHARCRRAGGGPRWRGGALQCARRVHPSPDMCQNGPVAHFERQGGPKACQRRVKR